jgi:hypothetical protein
VKWKLTVDDEFNDTEDVAVTLEWIAEKLRRGYKSGDEVAKWKLERVDAQKTVTGTKRYRDGVGRLWRQTLDRSWVGFTDEDPRPSVVIRGYNSVEGFAGYIGNLTGSFDEVTE